MQTKPKKSLPASGTPAPNSDGKKRDDGDIGSKDSFGLFREPDGKPSFSRIASAVILAATLVWSSYIVIETQKIPDLLGVTALVSSLYAVNRIGNAVDSVMSK